MFFVRGGTLFHFDKKRVLFSRNKKHKVIPYKTLFYIKYDAKIVYLGMGEFGKLPYTCQKNFLFFYCIRYFIFYNNFNIW